jgi:hypothetical protein
MRDASSYDLGSQLAHQPLPQARLSTGTAVASSVHLILHWPGQLPAVPAERRRPVLFTTRANDSRPIIIEAEPFLEPESLADSILSLSVPFQVPPVKGPH